jgi:beta-xylosidase
MFCAILTVLALAQQPALSLDDIHIRDPFVLPIADTKTYYLYGTGRPLGEPGFDAYKSKDLVHWEGPFAVFRPTPDYWGQRDFWAPEVHAYKGRFYMFATFSPSGEGPRGTAILVADAPEGPFVPHSDGPVTPAEWYALDGTLFIDEEEKPWMVFCHEWVQIGDGTMCVVRLGEDLSHTVGEPVNLFHASQASWGIESSFHGKPGRVTDGPWIERLPDGGLFMLWSTFGEGSAYSVGSARSNSGKITGPWEVQQDRIYSNDGGHPMLFKTFEGKRLMSLHQPNKSKRERARLIEVILDDAGVRLGSQR